MEEKKNKGRDKEQSNIIRSIGKAKPRTNTHLNRRVKKRQEERHGQISRRKRD